jgi:hypothetical protein
MNKYVNNNLFNANLKVVIMKEHFINKLNIFYKIIITLNVSSNNHKRTKCLNLNLMKIDKLYLIKILLLEIK